MPERPAEQPPPPASRAPELPALPRPDSAGNVDVSELNAALERHCGEVRFEQLTAHLAPVQRVATTVTLMLLRAGRPTVESPDEARLVVERSGLLDDAVSAERHTFRLVQHPDACNTSRVETSRVETSRVETSRVEAATWRVESARAEWRCARGVGPSAWTSAPCP